jgi:class 3 adenylate cyclase
MFWYQQLADRLRLPGEDEAMRSRRLAGIGVLFCGAAASLVNGLRYGAEGLAWSRSAYMLLVVGFICLMLLLIAKPRFFRGIVITAVFYSMVFLAAAHLAAGGYNTGMMFIQWTIVSIISAVIFVGRRDAVILLVIFLAIMIVTYLLEPRARALGVTVDPAFVSLDSTVIMMLIGALLTLASLYMFSEMDRYRRRADRLLFNILPDAIAWRLKRNPGTIADGFDEVTVLFADIVDFTTMSAAADPADVVQKLNEIFSEFDDLAALHGLEKIKTIGDAYMVAAGLPNPRPDHCAAVADFALAIVDRMAGYTSWNGRPMAIRVGINTGPVVAGVIGRQKFIYDLWGDTVNVASRMESNGLANVIQVTESVRSRLDGRYAFEERGLIAVKGKGEMVTYLLQRPAAL